MPVPVMLVLQFLPVSLIVEINMGSMVIVFLLFFVDNSFLCSVMYMYCTTRVYMYSPRC